VSSDELEELWAQRYVKEEFKQLGFSKVEGPFPRGPDFRVLSGRRWALAEVETCWQNYGRHGHPFSPAFAKVRYLILLSAKAPPANRRSELPPEVIHIDHKHFLDWYESVSKGKREADENRLRIGLVAGRMQEHWNRICGDADRELAVCPDCDSCAYFGEGMFGEAAPFFGRLAARFIIIHATTGSQIDISRIDAKSLQRFVEENPPD
jgi:hypothetical protein